MKCQIQEHYVDYSLHFHAIPLVRGLLRCVPKEDIAGLHHILLTNNAAQSRAQRRSHSHSRHRKVNLRECLGFYQPAWKQEPAHIQLNMDQIFVDYGHKNTLRYRIVRLLMAPLVRRLRIGSTLFHEIGHYAHTLHSQNGHRQSLAEKYQFNMIFKIYKHFWYLVPPFFLGFLLMPEYLLHMVKLLREAGKMYAK